MLGQSADDSRPDGARVTDDQRHPQGFVKAAVLLETAVLANMVAMIGRIDHHRILGEAELSQFGEHAANVSVQKLYRRIIRCGDTPLVGIGQVLEDQRYLPEVLGTGTRRREPRRPVALAILIREVVGRVRLQKTNPQRKRPAAVIFEEALGLADLEARAHVQLVTSVRQLVRVQPDAGWILERLPWRPYARPRRKRPRLHLLFPLAGQDILGVAVVEAMQAGLTIRLEVHLAEHRSGVAGLLELPCERRLRVCPEASSNASHPRNGASDQ